MFRSIFRPLNRQNIGRTVVGTIQWACVIHLFVENVASVHPSEGTSMLPTFNEHGDWLLQESLSRKLAPDRLGRGELISLVSPMDPTRLVCKRVIGLPGDTICVDPTSISLGKEHVIVPPGHVWVQGDNATSSRDSRTYGPVPIALIRGRIVARVWPSFKWFPKGMVYIDS